MVWECHFNLLEPIWMHNIVPWSFFVLITLPRNEKQTVCARFRARSYGANFFLVALLCTRH
jgi:hypothetical protein